MLTFSTGVQTVRSVSGSPRESPRSADEGRTLIDAIARGDADALAGLYDRHSGLAYSLCTLILGNPADAEEAVADTFLQVWRTADRFDPARGSVPAWIVTIARSRALDIARGRARRAGHVDETVDPATTTGASAGPSHTRVLPDTEQVDARRLTCWALEQLSDLQREVIELAYLDGLTHSEIAARLGAPIGTIKTRIRDGMKKLRVALAPAQERVGS